MRRSFVLTNMILGMFVLEVMNLSFYFGFGMDIVTVEYFGFELMMIKVGFYVIDEDDVGDVVIKEWV
jgi:hypothetical protein